MQIQLQAFARKAAISLRRAIADDLGRRGHDVLFLRQDRNPGRNPGWSKIAGRGLPGALNIEWDADAQMLHVRAITRGVNTPRRLLAAFAAYLIERHGKRIASINVQLR